MVSGCALHYLVRFEFVLVTAAYWPTSQSYDSRSCCAFECVSTCQASLTNLIQLVCRQCIDGVCGEVTLLSAFSAQTRTHGPCLALAKLPDCSYLPASHHTAGGQCGDFVQARSSLVRITHSHHGLYTPQTDLAASQPCQALYTTLYVVHTPNRPLASSFTRARTHGFKTRSSNGLPNQTSKVQSPVQPMTPSFFCIKSSRVLTCTLIGSRCQYWVRRIWCV